MYQRTLQRNLNPISQNAPILYMPLSTPSRATLILTSRDVSLQHLAEGTHIYWYCMIMIAIIYTRSQYKNSDTEAIKENTRIYEELTAKGLKPTFQTIGVATLPTFERHPIPTGTTACAPTNSRRKSNTEIQKLLCSHVVFHGKTIPNLPLGQTDPASSPHYQPTTAFSHQPEIVNTRATKWTIRLQCNTTGAYRDMCHHR
jgi:hypothetical protein